MLFSLQHNILHLSQRIFSVPNPNYLLLSYPSFNFFISLFIILLLISILRTPFYFVNSSRRRPSRCSQLCCRRIEFQKCCFQTRRCYVQVSIFFASFLYCYYPMLGSLRGLGNPGMHYTILCIYTVVLSD